MKTKQYYDAPAAQILTLRTEGIVCVSFGSDNQQNQHIDMNFGGFDGEFE